MNARAKTSDIYKQGAALIAGMFLIQALCFLLPWQARAESVKEKVRKQAHAHYRHLEGKWVRPDGGYVMELKSARSDGRLKALYFNPKPINVSKAEWRKGDRLQVFVELRDVNYPGSTYTLVYSPEADLLEGYYYQAAQGQTYLVQFVRAK
jgi:hypothetical protein